MSQASHKSKNANSLTLNNPVKVTAKTKSDRSSIDEKESNSKSKDVATKDIKETNKVAAANEEKNSAKKDKTPTVVDDEKTEKNVTIKSDDKLKNGSSTNSGDDSNTKISNGSHKNEESVAAAAATEEKNIRETRQKTTKIDSSAETVNDAGKSEKKEKSTDNKPTAAANKDKEKEKDKETTKSNPKDKKQEKEDKPPTVKDTPKKDTKDATKSTTTTSLSPPAKNKDIPKEPIKSKNADSLKPKSKLESTPSSKMAKKVEEKLQETVITPKVDKLKPIEAIVCDDVPMEPLVMQADIEEKTPKKTSAPTITSTPTPSSRILRMRSGPQSNNSDSPFSHLTIDDPKNNTSTCVNLSTLTNPHTPDKSYGAKVRSVSGRRPMLREISYKNSYRDHVRHNDSYASPNTINESTSSGYLDQSQRSVNTSSFVARKRYNDDNVVEEIGSPKRPRLDVSGLLTLVTSPVTMLRNRLARARIHNSTPNSKSNISKDDIEIDTVTASCIDEPKEAEEDYDMTENDEDLKELPKFYDFTAPKDIEINSDIKIKILKETNTSPFVSNGAIKKKWSCSLM